MALTVYPDAGYDSFISLAEADSYLASMGVTDWAGKTDPDREAALRRGTQYVTGRRLTTEALYDTSTDPYTARAHPNVKAATAEAAVRQARGQLYLDLDPAPITEKTVGPLTLKYGPQKNAGEKRFPVIEDLLFGLIVSAGPMGGPLFFERA